MALSKTVKYPLFFVAGLVILLTLLNPSYSRFKEYSTDVTSNKRKTICKRTFNGLIYSIYQRQLVIINEDGEYEYGPPETFYGFCLNFFKKN